MPEVSIIIVSHNTKTLTLQCIKSVFDSSKSLNFEIIVVDNGSNDGSYGEISKLKVRIIRNEENLGFSRANNQGIRLAEGKYILLLNSDTKVKRNSIDKLVKFAKSKVDAGVVGPRLLNPNGSLQPSAFRFPTIKLAIKQYWFGQGKPLDKFAPEGSEPSILDAVVGAAFLITPRALKIVGTLDERFFFFYEDLDYCRRVWKKGFKVYYLPEALVIHYHGASGEKITGNENQWRRLIPSSKIYHGALKHYIFNFILWSGQKWLKFFGK